MSIQKKYKTTSFYRHINNEVANILNGITSRPQNDINTSENIVIGSIEQVDQINENSINFDKNLQNNFEYNTPTTSVSEYDNCYAFGYCSSDSENLKKSHDLCDTSPSNDILNNLPKKNLNTIDRLRNWAITNKVTHNALRELLKILSESTSSDYNNLPKDPRTFLKTPREVITRDVYPGHYYHFGIQTSIELQYKSLCKRPVGIIEVGINVDGLPLSKSSPSQLYPILCINKSIEFKSNVILVGVYHGYEKPKDFNDFMSEFVSEAIELTNNGIIFFGDTYRFKISMFLFDAVAKASVLFIKGHSGYSSCTKCTQVGAYIKDRICFPNINYTKRTHRQFIEQDDGDHHTGHTILENIPEINLIDDVPLDYMHLICLGVVKKLVCNVWCFGKVPHKFSSSQFNNVSHDLETFSSYVPSEFARKPRGLREVKLWKATEFRQFLLYTAPLVLKNSLSKQKYQHFLTLTVAISILSSKKFCHMYTDYAESLLIHFVKTTKDLYGPEFLSHNFHNLLHLTDDVRKYGCLENFNNFSSENYMQRLLKFIRKPENPLAQIVRRVQELNFTESSSEDRYSEFQLIQEHSSGIFVNGCTAPEYKTLIFPNFKLSISTKDSCCILKDVTVIHIKNFAYCSDLKGFVVIGQIYTEKLDFFDKPCCSSLLNIYYVYNPGTICCWPLSQINSKLVKLPFQDGFVVYPLLHLN